MTSWPILSLMIFIPLFGAFFISLIDGDERTVNKNTKISKAARANQQRNKKRQRKRDTIQH